MDIYNIFNDNFMATYEMLMKGESSYFKRRGVDVNTKALSFMQTVLRLGNPTMSELARDRHVSKATCTFVVNRLEQQGYLEKVKNSYDKRITRVRCTPHARELVELHSDFHRWVVERIFADIPELDMNEMAGYSSDVVRILRNIESEHGQGFPSPAGD